MRERGSNRTFAIDSKPSGRRSPCANADRNKKVLSIEGVLIRRSPCGSADRNKELLTIHHLERSRSPCGSADRNGYLTTFPVYQGLVAPHAGARIETSKKQRRSE